MHSPSGADDFNVYSGRSYVGRGESTERQPCSRAMQLILQDPSKAVLEEHTNVVSIGVAFEVGDNVHYIDRGRASPGVGP